MVIIKKYLNVSVKFIFSAFIVVWLGSYLYDKLEISKLLDSFINMLAKSPTNFLDKVTKQVMSDSFTAKFWVFFVVISILGIIMFSFYLFSVIKNKNEKRRKLMIGGIVSMLFLYVYVFLNSGIGYSMYQKIVINTQQNIEIVRPYISQEEYILLKSNYLQIDNYDSYIKIDKQVKQIAEKNNLKTK